MVLNTTIWNQTFYQYFSIPLTIVVWAVTLTGIFCLWRGLLAIQRRAGLEPHAGGAVALLVWYLILIGLGLIQYSGLLFGIPVVIVYFFIIRSLYRLSSELDEAGYTVQAAPVRLSDRTVQCICVGILLVGGLTGYLRFSSYPMDWTPSNPQAEQAGLEDIRTHLLELGFPEKVLDDLSAEDLAACQGALQVIVDETDEPVNAGRSVTRRQGNHYTQTTEYDIKELHITGIAVQLPGERHHWKLFHHFSWTVNPGFYGTEAIQLWPTTRNQWWRVQGNFSGQILYDQDGVCYCSPYHSMGNFTYQKNTLFWGDQTSNDYFLTFSFPRQGERQRGYVSYEILAMQEGYIIDSWFNYVHQSSWAQYPVQTAMEHRISYSPFSRQSTFFTVQDALQVLSL